MRASLMCFTFVLLSLLTCVVTAADKPGGKAKERKKPAAAPAPTRAVTYKTVGDTKLALHIFEPAGHQRSDKRPAIVFFFGGGWNGGSPSQFYPHCAELAKRGMVAMSAEYRVKSRHKTTPFECVADGKSAIRWVRTHAKDLGVDPTKIAAGGGSAGGHVAATTGVIDGLEEPGEDKTVSSRPDALVLFNPVIDTGKKGFGYSRLKQRYKEISPVDHVNAGDPPTIIFHGVADTTVPFANAEDFAARMKKAGNRCQLEAYPGAKHGYFNYGRGGNTAYKKTTAQMFAFLTSLKLLP